MVTCKLYFPEVNSAENAALNLSKSDLSGVAMGVKCGTQGDAKPTSCFIPLLMAFRFLSRWEVIQTDCIPVLTQSDQRFTLN